MQSSPTILFEDDSIIVIDKPSQMHSVMTRDGSSHSVAAWLSVQHPSLREASPKEEDWGITNRLDFETSGILIAAKNRGIHDTIREFTKTSQIQKQYLALVHGQWTKDVVVNAHIGSRGRRSDLVRVFENPKPRDRALPAQTKFTPLCVSKEISIVAAEIAQGRRHQIRVHAKHLGHPLVGDTKYGSNSTNNFLLHSWKVFLPHPTTKKTIDFTAPIPQEFLKLRKEFLWRDLIKNIFRE